MFNKLNRDALLGIAYILFGLMTAAYLYEIRFTALDEFTGDRFVTFVFIGFSALIWPVYWLFNGCCLVISWLHDISPDDVYVAFLQVSTWSYQYLVCNWFFWVVVYITAAYQTGRTVGVMAYKSFFKPYYSDKASEAFSMLIVITVAWPVVWIIYPVVVLFYRLHDWGEAGFPEPEKPENDKGA